MTQSSLHPSLAAAATPTETRDARAHRQRWQELVFGLLRRSSTHAQSPLPGAGLGLALARGLARALGGDLRLARTGDVGATFEFVL